jgi:predicted ribonuclease toxin of YeeF-YezG toxin-antitoxin module
MKKSIFLFVTVAVLLWSCSTALSKGPGKGAGLGPAKPGKQSTKATVQENRKSQPRDPNQVKDQGKLDKTRLREQFRQNLGKPKSTTDVNQPGAKFGKAKPKTTADANQIAKLGKPKLKDLVPETEKAPGRGRLHQQQLKALQTQLIHEQAKHLWRLARLNRIRQLAAETGDTKTVERVDKLLGMENQRFSREQQRMQERHQKVIQLGERSLSQETPKGVGPKDKGTKEKEPDKTEPEDINEAPG